MKRLYLIKFVNTDKKIDVTIAENDFIFNELVNNYKVLDYIKLSVNGYTYTDRREEARSLAIAAQAFDSDTDFQFSYFELMKISNCFEKIGKQYGLLKEFRENAIC